MGTPLNLNFIATFSSLPFTYFGLSYEVEKVLVISLF